MQIRRCYWAICMAVCGLAVPSTRAEDTSTQAPPLAATSPQTVTNKAELKKQAQAEAKAKKEADKKAKAEAEAKKKAEKANAEQSGTHASASKKGAAVQPIEAPPLPISADKQQRLQELLKKYKAEELTPDQYQKERAKILAEP
jgi:hypothetical protein